MIAGKRTYITCVGILLLFVVAEHMQAQGLKSVDETTTNLAELRVEANFTKQFRVRNQRINLHVSEEIYSRLYESTYSKLADDTEDLSPYFRRSYTTVGLSYTPIPYLRIGADYTLKLYGNKLQTSDGTPNVTNEFLRHRLSAHVTGQYMSGDWKFSLREKLDATIRTDSVNLYEQPQTTLILRHRLMATYTVPGRPLKAYANVELWNTLNQPVKYLNTYAGVDKDGNATAYAGQTFGQYLSEVRAQVGLRWRVDKCNTLGIAYMFMYGYSRDVNITKNKSMIELTHATSYGHYILVSYDLEW